MLQIFIVSTIVFALWYSFKDGEIFGAFQKVNLRKFANPLRDCPVCMTPWYGTLIYFLYTDPGLAHFRDLVFTIIPAMGVNVILIMFFPDKETPGVHHELGEISDSITDLTQWLRDKELKQPGPKFHPKQHAKK